MEGCPAGVHICTLRSIFFSSLHTLYSFLFFFSGCCHTQQRTHTAEKEWHTEHECAGNNKLARYYHNTSIQLSFSFLFLYIDMISRDKIVRIKFRRRVLRA